MIHAQLLTQRSPPTCFSCLLRAEVRSFRRSARRSFHQKSFRLREDAGHPLPTATQIPVGWGGEAADIKAGCKESILTVLEKRGLVNQIVGQRNDLDRLVTEEKAGVYLGIDPTAPSLHVGHLVPLMALYWMYSHGFPAFLIVGGFTAKFGDPSWRTTERELQNDSILEKNTEKINRQLDQLWLGTDKELRRNKASSEDIERQRETMNNSSWLETNIVEYMLLSRRLGIGPMLGRSLMKTKRVSQERVSVEASWYPMFQAWDFWHLYSTKGVRIQIGGSDQFGNILTGLDLIKFFKKKQALKGSPEDEESSRTPMGFTIPLLTTTSGEKFGKSAGNALWLDPDLTSPFHLYQYFLRTADDDVHRYLRLFTFESLQSLQEVMDEHIKAPHKRLAQHKLALNVLRLVHGDEKAERARHEHSVLFQSAQGYSPVSIREIATRWESAPPADSSGHPDEIMTLPISKIFNRSIPQVLLDAGLVSSRNEGKQLCASGGAYVGVRSSSEGTDCKWQPVSKISEEDRGNAESLVIDDLLSLRAGKTKVRHIVIATDEDPKETHRRQHSDESR